MDTCIYKYSPSGERTVFTTGINSKGITVDSNDNLYASDFTGRILKVTPDGEQSIFFSGLGGVCNIALDESGNLFAAELYSDTISKITPDGEKTDFTFEYLSFGDLAYTSVPEPSSFILLACGALWVLCVASASRTRRPPAIA